nr:MAG TPA: hypothetical protein [Caudoviricetes sp.]
MFVSANIAIFLQENNNFNRQYSFVIVYLRIFADIIVRQ